MNERSEMAMSPTRVGPGWRRASRLGNVLMVSITVGLAGCARSANLAGNPAEIATGTSRTSRVEVTEASIPELQAALSDGRLTSVELVDAYLARIEAYDQAGPALNAIIAINPAAREDAVALDRERALHSARGPLHGIPIILKDNYDAVGLPTTGGSIALVGHMPAVDAHQVRLLREAGAIVLAKSNLHELAYGITTVSSVGGQTRNPYDLERNPGGSSGGTGAAIAASFAAIGWGTDTCGSIRVPASANNLFGLRPTKGLSSISGILPLSHTQDVGGPLARTMIDLAIGLQATIGADPDDPATRALAGRRLPSFIDANDPEATRGARIGVLTQYFGEDPEDFETNSLIRLALNAFTEIGAEVIEVEVPGFEEMISGTSLIDFEFKWDLMDYLARTPNPPVTSLAEIVEGQLHHDAVAGILRRSDRHQTREPDGIEETRERRTVLTEAMLAFMDEHRLDALAYPSLRRIPALIGQPAVGNNCQLSAATGFPALTVPAGFTSEGVPVGLELLGRPFADERLVSLGFAFEAAVQPRRAPASTPPLRE